MKIADTDMFALCLNAFGEQGTMLFVSYCTPCEVIWGEAAPPRSTDGGACWEIALFLPSLTSAAAMGGCLMTEPV